MRLMLPRPVSEGVSYKFDQKSNGSLNARLRASCWRFVQTTRLTSSVLKACQRLAAVLWLGPFGGEAEALSADAPYARTRRKLGTRGCQHGQML